MATTWLAAIGLLSAFSLGSGVQCDFSAINGMCGYTQSTADDFQWTRKTGSTGSANTGPASDHTSGTSSGYYMYIETSVRTQGDSAKLVSPYYFGKSTDECLEFYYHMYGTGMGTLNVYIGTQKLWTVSGNRGNNWLQGKIPIPRNNGMFKVTFEGIRGSTFMSDIAIDDVVITTGTCLTPSATIRCDFEDYGICGYTQSTSDDFQWTRNRGGTFSTNTGPTTDHSMGTSAGYYMYMESSSPRRQGDSAKLLSPYYVGKSTDECLEFYYHMYGTGMGTLNVYIGTQQLWTVSGNRGNNWLHGKVPIARNSGSFMVIFEGIRGSTTTGDIAIDDVVITTGTCLTTPGTFGSIKSQGYPNQHYSSNTDLTWTILAPVTHYVFVKLVAMDIESCCDRIMVKNARTNAELQSWSGRFNALTANVNTLTDHVEIRFTSDSSIERTGFMLSWYTAELPAVTTTTGLVPTTTRQAELVAGTSGSIKSPGYPYQDYSSNTDLTWTILAPVTHYVFVDLVAMDTESCCDRILVKNARTNAELQSWSGNFTEIQTPHVNTRTNHVEIRFTSDSSIEGTGFMLSWYTAQELGVTTMTGNVPTTTRHLELGHVYPIIVGSTAGVFVLITIIIISCCIWCKGKPRRNNAIHTAAENQTVSTVTRGNVYETATVTNHQFQPVQTGSTPNHYQVSAPPTPLDERTQGNMHHRAATEFNQLFQPRQTTIRHNHCQPSAPPLSSYQIPQGNMNQRASEFNQQFQAGQTIIRPNRNQPSAPPATSYQVPQGNINQAAPESNQRVQPGQTAITLHSYQGSAPPALLHQEKQQSMNQRASESNQHFQPGQSSSSHNSYQANAIPAPSYQISQENFHQRAAEFNQHFQTGQSSSTPNNGQTSVQPTFFYELHTLGTVNQCYYPTHESQQQPQHHADGDLPPSYSELYGSSGDMAMID